ncbi:stalk domain-containing protein [Kineothrix sp. MB12-C1]|uniref:stalk domain-containing protein n=1 Tax=Kineothrix sp. MB12-C1 TaxID=3070215 RepID=UPI0027D3487F|nr:stalk domain-containing protein [Kineothrix sp. MB12-C1]WMC93722.1 stalk domain-containing protein [Kineothrix sp. MB12-C1]
MTACKKEEKEVIEPPQVETQSKTQESISTENNGQEEAEGKETEIAVYLNGNYLELMVSAYQSEEKVMVPMAEICEYFSRDLVCTQEGNTLTIVDEKMEKTIILTEGSDKALVNDKEVKLEAPTVLTEDGNLMAELSSFRILLDADCKYQEEMQSVYITESGLC